MKNIVHLLYSGLGGHGSVFFSMARAAEKKDYTFKAVFCGIEPVRDDYVTQCKTDGISYGAVLKKRGLDPAAYIRLYKEFKKAKPDVLFLHGSTFILSAAIYKLFHRKTRLIVRDTQAHHLKTNMEWRWLKMAARYADNLVFLTRESQEGAINGTKSKRIAGKAVIISNGLDTNFYIPAPRTNSGSIIIGMQSRLQPIKDHPTLLRAFKILQEKRAGEKLELHIAGDGETRNGLEQLAKELGIASSVRFFGMLDEPNLLGFMQGLDIYVHATDGETMSNSIMQALSCGLPVIASDVWGVNNMIKDGENGLLYTHKNEIQLAETIQGLLADEGLKKQLALNGRNYAEKEFSLQQVFGKYAALFNA